MTLNERLTEQLKGMGGWCDPAKAIRMAEYVQSEKLIRCVEVGVFAGKSAISTAMTLREIGGGILYAVDSWAVSDSLVDVSAADADWWSKNVNLDNIYEEFLKHTVATGTGRYMNVLRMASLDAVKIVSGEIDMLHIDGCHSEWSSTTDVCLWLPKVKSGGLVVMDDANWPTTQTAIRFVEKFCTKLEILTAKESVCGFFRKR